ncbi:unnamed protein product, partial [Iphiclides podalirius]
MREERAVSELTAELSNGVSKAAHASARPTGRHAAAIIDSRSVPQGFCVTTKVNDSGAVPSSVHARPTMTHYHVDNGRVTRNESARRKYAICTKPTSRGLTYCALSRNAMPVRRLWNNCPLAKRGNYGKNPSTMGEAICSAVDSNRLK